MFVKKNVLFVIIVWACSHFNLHAQVNIDSLSRKEINTIRKKEYYNFNEWAKNFFNHPGSGWYVNLNISYGIPFITTRSGSTIAWLGNVFKNYNSNGSTTLEARYGSAGGGFDINLQLGRMHNSFIGYGLLMNYSQFPKTTDVVINDKYYKASQTTEPYIMGFSPYIHLSSGNMRNFYVFAKVGPYLPIWGGAETLVKAEDSELTLITDFLLANTPEADILRGIVGLVKANFPNIPLNDLIELQISADAQTSFKATVGISATIGCKYQFNKIWSLTAEARVTAFSIEAKQTKLEDFVFDGKIIGIPLSTILPDGIDIGGNTLTFPINSSNAPLAFTTTNYSRIIDEKSNNKITNPNGFDYNKPVDDLSFKSSANGLYFGVGVQVNIPKKKDRNKNKSKKI